MLLKTFVSSFTLCAALVLTSYQASAKAKIPLGNREVLTLVSDLPDTEDYLLEKGSKLVNRPDQYLDLATLHEEFNIAWILPLWINKEPRLVGYNKAKDMYYDIPEEEMNEILAKNKLERKNLEKVGFYTRYGGKLVALLIIAFIIWGMIPSKKKAEDIKPQTV